MADSYKLYIYTEESGKCPFKIWMGKLDREIQSRIDRRLVRVSEGNLGDYKAVGDGVFELRIFVGPGYRVYFGLVEETIVLLLTGGDKGSQDRDIVKAKEFWQNYLETSDE